MFPQGRSVVAVTIHVLMANECSVGSSLCLFLWTEVSAARLNWSCTDHNSYGNMAISSYCTNNRSHDKCWWLFCFIVVSRSRLSRASAVWCGSSAHRAERIQRCTGPMKHFADLNTFSSSFGLFISMMVILIPMRVSTRCFRWITGCSITYADLCELLSADHCYTGPVIDKFVVCISSGVMVQWKQLCTTLITSDAAQLYFDNVGCNVHSAVTDGKWTVVVVYGELMLFTTAAFGWRLM